MKKPDENVETLRDGVRAVRDDAERLASNAYSAVRTAADDTVEDVRQQGDELIESISDYVAQRPLTSLGIAVAAGFILAKIWR